MAGRGANVVLADGCGVFAELLGGLHVDAITAVVEVEIVDVLRAHEDLEGVRDLTERNAEGFGLIAVNADQHLGIVGGKAGAELGDVFALIAFGDQEVRCAVEVGEGVAAAILQLKLEAAKQAEALDGGIRLPAGLEQVVDAEPPVPSKVMRMPGLRPLSGTDGGSSPW